ncbi:hypothetical protein D3C86_1655930 [compost metagenome]
MQCPNFLVNESVQDFYIFFVSANDVCIRHAVTGVDGFVFGCQMAVIARRTCHEVRLEIEMVAVVGAHFVDRSFIGSR